MHSPTHFSLASPGHGIQHAARQFVESKVANTWTVTVELGRLGACARAEAPRDKRTRSRVAAALVEQVMVDFKSSASAAAHTYANEGIAVLHKHCAAKGTRITARHVKLLGEAVAQATGDIGKFPAAVRKALGAEPVLPALHPKSAATQQRITPGSATSTPNRLPARVPQLLARPSITTAPAKPVRLVTVQARDPRQHELLLQRRREWAQAAQAASLAEGKPQ